MDVVSAGYFAQWNGGESVDDKMSPYLIKVNNLSVNEEEIQRISKDNFISENQRQHLIRNVQPIADYSEPMAINLPTDVVDECDDRIDGSICKQNGKYYLTIKRNGVTNEMM